MNMLIEFLRRRPEPRQRALTTVILLAGAAGLLVTSYIHWHLWHDDGYRHIPTIGWLFLLQAISGVVIVLLILAFRELWTAVIAAGFVASTLVGFLLSVTRGFLGFRDSWFAPFAKEAFGFEVGSILVFVLAVALMLRTSKRH
jgi:VanZ family protein